MVAYLQHALAHALSCILCLLASEQIFADAIEISHATGDRIWNRTAPVIPYLASSDFQSLHVDFELFHASLHLGLEAGNAVP